MSGCDLLPKVTRFPNDALPHKWRLVMDASDGPLQYNARKGYICVVLSSAGAAALSGGGGYGRLGGIQQYSQTLKELVLLPLQLPQLFAK